MIRRLLIPVLIVCLIAPLRAFAGTCCRTAEPAMHLTTSEACCPATGCAMSASQCPSNARIQQAILPAQASCAHLKAGLEALPVVREAGLLKLVRVNLTGSPFSRPPENSLFSLSFPLRL